MFFTPGRQSAPVKSLLMLTNFWKDVRREIHKFYTVKKVVPSIRKLNAALKASDIINCNDEYLHKFIRRIGYRWKKCCNHIIKIKHSY